MLPRPGHMTGINPYKSPGNFSSLMWDGLKQVPLEDLGWSQALFIVFWKYYRGKIFSWVAKHQREWFWIEDSLFLP